MCDQTPRATIALPQTLRAPELARRFITAHACLAHDLPLDDAMLLVSEATTNAVLHGGPPIVLAIDCGITTAEISVRDGSFGRPALSWPELEDEHGRGLMLIKMLSDAWGIDRIGPGKELWFVLRRGP